MSDNIMRSRKDTGKIQAAPDLPGQRIKFTDTVDLITKEFNPHSIFKCRYRKDLQHIPVYTECSTMEIHIISDILDIRQFIDHHIPILDHSDTERQHLLPVFIRITDTVNTGYRGYDHNILSVDQCCSCTVTHLVNIIVDRRILRYISISRCHICFRLVIIIIRNKIFYRIFRKKFLHFRI